MVFWSTLMSSSRFYSPETVGRMITVYKRAVQELKIERASVFTHERLARCILSIGNTHTDPHRLLDQSIRLYLRSPTTYRRSRMYISRVAWIDMADVESISSSIRAGIR
jgi:hypothetical protein